jgi:hypothetical protein
MSTDKTPLPMNDVPEVRAARIALRVAELKQLAAQASLDYARAQPEPSFREQLRAAILRQRNGGRRP